MEQEKRDIHSVPFRNWFHLIPTFSSSSKMKFRNLKLLIDQFTRLVHLTKGQSWRSLCRNSNTLYYQETWMWSSDCNLATELSWFCGNFGEKFGDSFTPLSAPVPSPTEVKHILSSQLISPFVLCRVSWNWFLLFTLILPSSFLHATPTTTTTVLLH